MMYIVEVQYVHSQDDLDLIDVEAIDRAEAVAYASLQFRRRAWATLRDVQIVSATAHELDTRRYSLTLDSHSDDLDVQEARA